MSSMPTYIHQPAPPRKIDREIAAARGSTVALDATRERLEAHKTTHTPSLKEIIESKTRENGRLRAEVVYLQSLGRLGEELRNEVDYVSERLRLALMNYQRAKETIAAPDE